MSKKALDTQAITNELREASLFFQRPQSPPAKEKVEAESVRTYVRTDVRTPPVDTTSKPRRIKIRHAFNIYSDQLIELQLMEMERVRAEKKKKTLSAMVTKAIDDYLAKHERLQNRG